MQYSLQPDFVKHSDNDQIDQTGNYCWIRISGHKWRKYAKFCI